MKNYTRLFLVLVLVSAQCLISTSFAHQEKKSYTPEERAEKITTWMQTNLKLSDSQLATVKEINLKYAQLNEKLKDGSTSKKEKLKALKTNDDAKDEELKKVFSDEQFKTYQQKKDEIKALLKEKMKEKKQS